MNNKLLSQLALIRLSNLKPNFSELSRIYGFDRRTIKKYYDGYEGKPKSRQKTSVLDEHLELIRLKLGIKGSTVKAVYEYIISEVDANIGTYSNFNKFVVKHGLKPKRTPKGHPRFETAPGYQAQADWKENLKIANRYGEIFTIQVFDYKLGHSRYCHFTYKTTRTRQDVFDCLISSFKATGGVPTEILFDNMTSVVDINGKDRCVNRKMKAFADDFGFRVRLARPRHAFTKGKVEVINKFLAWLLPYEGEFETEDELIAILEKINKKANEQACQETGVPPLLLFQKEKEYLQDLPSKRIIESYQSYDRQILVRKDSLITYKNNRYSVPPAYIDKTVCVKQDENKLMIYYNTMLVATHYVTNKKLNYKKEHYIDLLHASLKDEDLIAEMADNNLRLMDDFL